MTRRVATDAQAGGTDPTIGITLRTNGHVTVGMDAAATEGVGDTHHVSGTGIDGASGSVLPRWEADIPVISKEKASAMPGQVTPDPANALPSLGPFRQTLNRAASRGGGPIGSTCP